MRLSNNRSSELGSDEHLLNDLRVNERSGSDDLRDSNNLVGSGDVLVDRVNEVIDVESLVKGVLLSGQNRSVEISDSDGSGWLRSGGRSGSRDGDGLRSGNRLGSGDWLSLRSNVLEDSNSSIFIRRSLDNIVLLSVEVADHIRIRGDSHLISEVLEVVVSHGESHNLELIGVNESMLEVILLVLGEESSDGSEESLLLLREVKAVSLFVLDVSLGEREHVFWRTSVSDGSHSNRESN